MNTIATEWGRFEFAVMPKGASEVQRQEMRRAFYAGAEAVLRLQFAVGDQAMSEDAGVAIIEGWHDECRQFAQQVANGAA